MGSPPTKFVYELARLENFLVLVPKLFSIFNALLLSLTSIETRWNSILERSNINYRISCLRNVSTTMLLTFKQRRIAFLKTPVYVSGCFGAF